MSYNINNNLDKLEKSNQNLKSYSSQLNEEISQLEGYSKEIGNYGKDSVFEAFIEKFEGAMRTLKASNDEFKNISVAIDEIIALIKNYLDIYNQEV